MHLASCPELHNGSLLFSSYIPWRPWLTDMDDGCFCVLLFARCFLFCHGLLDQCCISWNLHMSSRSLRQKDWTHVLMLELEEANLEQQAQYMHTWHNMMSRPHRRLPPATTYQRSCCASKLTRSRGWHTAFHPSTQFLSTCRPLLEEHTKQMWALKLNHSIAFCLFWGNTMTCDLCLS